MTTKMKAPIGVIQGMGALGKVFPVLNDGFAYVDDDSVTTLQGANWTTLGKINVPFDPNNLLPTAPVLFPNGTAAAPSVSFAGSSTQGLYNNAGGTAFASGGLYVGSMRSSGTFNANAFEFGYSGDLFLYRDAPNTLAQRNGAAAQTFNLYNTYTDAANYEGMRLTWNNGLNLAKLETFAAGTGVARNLYLGSAGTLVFQTASADKIYINNGSVQPAVDNGMSLGASTNRYGTLYASQINAATKAGAFVAADLAAGTFMVGRDTVGLTTKLYYNNAGTLMSVALA